MIGPHDRKILAACAAPGLLCAAAGAALIEVPFDHRSIQQAIDAASDGDVVEVAPGTYPEAIDFLGKDIIVRATSRDPELTVIDASSFSAPTVHFHGGEPASALLEGFTITGGSGGQVMLSNPVGGGILVNSSDPTILNCIVEGNASEDGGGAYLEFSDSLISSCVFRDNLVIDGFLNGGHGGGVHVKHGSPVLTNCTFETNTAQGAGGGVYVLSANGTQILDCTFASNTSIRGGGLYVENTTLAVTDCTFDQNLADHPTLGEGGGVAAVAGGDAELRRCRLTNNAGRRGGGLYTVSSSPVAGDSIFTGNTALDRGGAIALLSGGDPVVVNCTIWNNTALAAGGGSGLESDLTVESTVANSILWGNPGLEIAVNGSAAPEVRYCLVDGGWPGPGNIDADPLFVNAPGGDLRLSAGSPAADAGDNGAPEIGCTDHDDEPRRANHPASADTGLGALPIVDMGAHESQGCFADFDGSDSIGFTELNAVLGAWGPCPCCPEDLVPDGTVGFADLNLVLALWGPC